MRAGWMGTQIGAGQGVEAVRTDDGAPARKILREHVEVGCGSKTCSRSRRSATRTDVRKTAGNHVERIYVDLCEGIGRT